MRNCIIINKPKYFVYQVSVTTADVVDVVDVV